MKKNGFTLAEVLITLAIIGVVATLTLPALMTNTAEQQAKTAFKKGINTLTEAAQMNQAIEGFDYASLSVADTENQDSQSLYGLLTRRASVDFQKSGTSRLVTQQGTASSTASTNYALFFRDGSALMFPANVTSSQGSEGQTVAPNTIQDDNLVYGISLIYDTNGAKGPNILSNCTGAALGAGTDTLTLQANESPEAALRRVCTNRTRVIKDQFGIRLRGGYAVPNGAAAQWAFNN